jgi:hypothetical protein
MSATHSFLGVADDLELVLEWFRALPNEPHLVDRGDDWVVHISSLGPIETTLDGGAIPAASPLVYVAKPRVVRRTLWTVGEVVFSATPLRRRFPELEAINRRFAKWLSQYPCVFARGAKAVSAWDYFLEGQIRNLADRVVALPVAYDALQRGQYFVHPMDSADALDRLCRTLRLRGVPVEISD